MFANASMDLGNEMTLSGELRGNTRTSAQELAPMPYNSPTDPGYAGTFDGAGYNGISEQNYYLRRAVDAYNAANPTATPLVYEPVRDARRRMIETTRRFEQDIKQIQANLTLTGVFGEVDWEVYYNKGYRQRQDVDYGQFFGPALSNAMGPSADLDGDGQPECYEDINDPSTLIAGCVPFNFFGGGVVAPNGVPTLTTVTQDMIDYVGVDLVDTYKVELDQGGLAFTGTAWDLPGGAMGWAAGYEYRKERLTYSPDSAKQKDEVTGNTGAGTSGKYDVNSFYAELFTPFFDNGSQSVSLTLGGRYDDFSTFGDNWTYQAGLEFQVIDNLKLRATTGEVYRAPNIYELFGGQVDSFPTYTDPCDPDSNQGVLAPGCAQTTVQLDTQVLARVGGNPNLQPESGDTITAGIVWTPTFGDHDISLTVDYWRVKLDDLITALGVQYILDDCYVDQNASSCALVTRRAADYSIAQVLDAPLNAAKSQADGVDTEIRWNFESSIGEWEASVLWAHYNKFERQAFPGDDKERIEGRFLLNSTAFAEDKINYSFAWFYNDISVRYLGEYISGLDGDVNFLSDYIQDIDSQLYHDLIFGYDIRDWGTRISAGVTNFTDEAPPYIDAGFNASTDPSTYRLFGRGYYVRIQQSFE